MPFAVNFMLYLSNASGHLRPVSQKFRIQVPQFPLYVRIPKKLPTCKGQILLTCVVLQDASVLARFERVLFLRALWRRGSWRTNFFKTITRKHARRTEGSCRNLERGFHLKAEKKRLKIPEKMDQEKFYAIDMRPWLFDRNPVIRRKQLCDISVRQIKILLSG